MPKTIFVSGGNGQIGSHLLPLLQKKYFVKALLRNFSQKHLKLEKGEWIEGDITQPASYAHALEKCDALIHLAACTSNANEKELEKVNVQATIELVKKAHGNGIKNIVIASTAAVTQKWLTPYAKSKIRMEGKLREMGIPLIIIRPTLEYSKGSKYLKKIIKLTELPFPFFIPLPKKGDVNIQPVHGEDIAKAIMELVKEKPKEIISYDIASVENFSLREMIYLIQEKKGSKKIIIDFPYQLFQFLYDFCHFFHFPGIGKLASYGAFGESYHVNPFPLIEKYKLVFVSPREGIGKCAFRLKK